MIKEKEEKKESDDEKKAKEIKPVLLDKRLKDTDRFKIFDWKGRQIVCINANVKEIADWIHERDFGALILSLPFVDFLFADWEYNVGMGSWDVDLTDTEISSSQCLFPR